MVSQRAGKAQYLTPYHHTLLQAKNSEMLVECFYALEDFRALGHLMEALPEGNVLLRSIGEKFQSVGLCNEGVSAFLKVCAGVQRHCAVLLSTQPSVVIRSTLTPVLTAQYPTYQIIERQFKVEKLSTCVKSVISSVKRCMPNGCQEKGGGA